MQKHFQDKPTLVLEIEAFIAFGEHQRPASAFEVQAFSENSCADGADWTRTTLPAPLAGWLAQSCT